MIYDLCQGTLHNLRYHYFIKKNYKKIKKCQKKELNLFLFQIDYLVGRLLTPFSFSTWKIKW